MYEISIAKYIPRFGSCLIAAPSRIVSFILTMTRHPVQNVVDNLTGVTQPDGPRTAQGVPAPPH